MFNWLRVTFCTITVAIFLSKCSANDDKNKVSSDDGYIEWYKGTGRVIISAPHGGKLEPQSIPKRNAAGCVKLDGKCTWSRTCRRKNPKKCRSVVIPDRNSLEMAFSIYETLVKKGLSPHLIVNNLSRSRLDPNREAEEATQNDKVALKAYRYFHHFTAKAKASIDGPGLLIEIHGHGHFENWTELGYRIGKKELRSKKYSALNSTIRALIKRREKENLGDLIAGDNSFGGYLQRGIPGFDFVPSPKYNAPFKTSKYFKGGFNLERYGSKNGGCVDAIQMEFPKHIRHKSGSFFTNVSVSVANVVEEFMKNNRYYEPNEKNNCPP